MELPAESAATRPRTAGALLAAVAGLVFGAIFFGGGSSDASLAVLGSLIVAAASAALAAAALGWFPLPALDKLGLATLVGGAGLVAWTGLSVIWSIAGDKSWIGLGKGLVYAAFLVLGIGVAAALGRRGTRAVAAVLAAVLALALVWALLGRAVPGLFPEGGRIARLRNPVGYWNALALLADAAIPLGLWLATTVRRSGARAAGVLLVYCAVLVLLLTESRAGVVGAASVLALWLALSRARLAGGLLVLVAAPPAIAVAAWVFSRPALVENGATRADRVDDGALFGGLALLGAAAALVLAWRIPFDRLVAERARTVARALAALAAVAVVAGIVGVTLASGDELSRGECANAPGRLTDLCANNRLEWWREALDVFTAHPVAGTGVLTFEIARKRVRDDATPVAQPHSVPLQLLADVGVVGFLLGAVTASAAAIGVVRALRRLEGAERGAALGLVGLPVAFGVHALVDYDLDFVAVTGPALLVVGALLAADRPAVRVPGGAVTAAAAVVTALAVVAVLVTPALAEREVDRATLALDEGRLAAAQRAADRARALNPLSLDPVTTAAVVAERQGDPALARALYRRATEMQPENPEPWLTLGLHEYLARGDLCAAYQALNNAYTLDPNGREWVPGGPLDAAREAVNEGACE